MNKNKNNNFDAKKLSLIAVAAIAVIVIAFSIKFPGKTNEVSTTGTADGTTNQTTEVTTDETTNQATIVKDNDIVISVNDITETATFYPAEINGTKLEVLAVKAPDGSIRTAFNTCQVCYSSGRGYYEQEGDALVCQNCGNRFGMDDVEVTKGGCNPVPITSDYKTVEGDTITISKDYLAEATAIFSNWK